MARPKKIQTLAVETETMEMSELVQHGQKIHQIYRDVDMLGRGIPGTVTLPEVTAYLDQYLLQGWRLDRVEMAHDDIGEDKRAPQPVLRMLYILVK